MPVAFHKVAIFICESCVSPKYELTGMLLLYYVPKPFDPGGPMEWREVGRGGGHKVCRSRLKPVL